ncbi:MAG TPA: hypothetical protein VGC05_02750 [Mycobacterium sp.]
MTALDEEQTRASDETADKIDEVASGETGLDESDLDEDEDEDEDEADLDEDELDSETAADEVPSAYRFVAHRHSTRVALLRRLRKLEKRAVELPLVGKLHAPDTHDVVYVVGMVGLLAFGAVELPIALIVLGGHVLVKQHQSRSLSAIGEVMEDVFGHHI